MAQSYHAAQAHKAEKCHLCGLLMLFDSEVCRLWQRFWNLLIINQGSSTGKLPGCTQRLVKPAHTHTHTQKPGVIRPALDVSSN